MRTFLASSQQPTQTPNKAYPHSGEASPKGKTQAEKEKYLNEQSKSHPNSYKDTSRCFQDNRVFKRDLNGVPLFGDKVIG
jgi:hypothetical protein